MEYYPSWGLEKAVNTYLTDRDILQMYQAEPDNQSSLGLLQECRPNPVMDSDMRLPLAGLDQG